MGRLSKRSRYQRLKRLSHGPFSALTVLYGRRFLADYPDFWPGWIWVGRALVGLTRYEEAEQAFAKALELSPTNQRQRPLAQIGHLFMSAGDYDQSAEWYRKAIEVDPGNDKNHIYLGGVLAQQGRLHDAEEELRVAIACDGDCLDDAHLKLGLVLRGRERFREAADCFRETIRIGPEERAARRALRDVEWCIKLEEG